MTLDKTMFAMEAFTFADRFHTCFIGRQVEGFKLFLTAPEGQSTGGGLQAIQHITLQDETSSRTIVLGSANGVGKQVELRSYARIVQVFTKRFPGVAFPIPEEEYDKLQEAFTKFFEMLKFDVTRENAEEDDQAATVSPSPTPRPNPNTASRPPPTSRPSRNLPQYARGAAQARKAPPPFSLGEFLATLPRWCYLLGAVALLFFLYALLSAK